jgi:predicted TIM-barrel fold metal-dependent hydrolase
LPHCAAGKIITLPFKYLHVRLILLLIILSVTTHAQNPDTSKAGDISLSSFRPVSIYKTPKSNITRAKYPAYDMHSHDYPKTDQEVQEWIRVMDAKGVAKTIILSGKTGAGFDSAVERYSKYKDRFEVWCGFDYTGADQPGWEKRAVAELERCHRKGAGGVGELGDKGLGELYSDPTPGYGIHIDDPRMKSLIRKCGELKMPINIHVAEDQWMYLPPDSTNDGLLNAATWHVDMSDPKKLDHDQLVRTLENAVRDNPNTTFIASHLANTCSDLSMLGSLFDKYPNLYADISARYGEFAPVPRYTHAFMEKYADRLVYGTDMGVAEHMYVTTFRILESADEHFYERELFNYHWALHGLALTDATLKKIYSSNALKILARK